MKIAASNISIQSEHSSLSSYSRSESLRVWQSQTTAQLAQLSAAATQAAAETASGQTTVTLDPRTAILRTLIEILTGKEIRLTDLSALRPPSASEDLRLAAPTPLNMQGTTASTGMEYQASEHYQESEQARFSASGSILTSDGRKVDFQLDLQMQRSYSQDSSINISSGQAPRLDPLVINFNGPAALLQNQKFSFDINGDGNKENLPTLASGSGYLALDLNGNGLIDSGKELFGPQSGSGFGELALLDSDHNGWIDENDARFADLKIWQPDATGKGTLTSLSQAGVGALYTGKAATAFELRDAQQNDLGAIKETGLYLGENGSVGTLQEVDISV